MKQLYDVAEFERLERNNADLLAALRLIIEHWHAPTNPHWQLAVQAIAKATGNEA